MHILLSSSLGELGRSFLVFLVLCAAAAVYLVFCRAFPMARCRGCRGTGKRFLFGFARRHRTCKGTGWVTRPGLRWWRMFAGESED